MSAALLSIEGVSVDLPTPRGNLRAVDRVNLAVGAGRTLGVVGESGCGKTMLSRAILQLLPKKAALSGRVRFDGQDLTRLGAEPLRKLRGHKLAVVFQDPMTSLNPVLTIGSQIAEAVLLHESVGRKEAWAKAVDMLRLTRIPAPEQRANEYPHQLSGGMRQRAMIAMALACNPKVLIADEPTTALDVTIQAQILDLILDLQQKLGTAVILITHDLGVVAETAHRVIVMYAGKKVEEAPVEELFARPQHTYTHGLMASIPRLPLMRGDSDAVGERLQEIPGTVPALTDLPPGCVFAPRCAHAIDRCRAEYPPYEEKRPGHWAACWRSRELYGAGDE